MLGRYDIEHELPEKGNPVLRCYRVGPDGARMIVKMVLENCSIIVGSPENPKAFITVSEVDDVGGRS